MVQRSPEIGEEVYHKSGGPKMVVVDKLSYGEHAIAKCVYFNPISGSFESGDFLELGLIISDKPEEVRP